MKALKIVGFILGGILVLLAVLVALALTPSVQTWAVRKAMTGQPGTEFAVGRVDAGLSSADISELRYAKDGTIVTAKNISARYSAWDFITDDRINADQVTVQDLVIDLRNTASAATPPSKSPDTTTPPPDSSKRETPNTASATPGSSAPFEGILQQAKLPFELRVAQLSAQGRALLPNNQNVVFDLSGSGIQTGERGKLEWTVDFSDATAGAPLRALRSTGTAHVHIARDGRIDLVEIDTIASAMGPNIPPDRVQLTARLEQPAPGGNEGYAANVALLRGNATEPLLKTTAQYIASSREIAGAWELAVRSQQLAALLAGLGLPELAANGGGNFTFKPDTHAVAASGDLQGQVSKLDQIAPALAAVGTTQFRVTFDGGLAGDVAQLNKFAVEATGADGRKFADITSAQRVGYELDTKRITFADAKAALARITLQALPLAWAQPLLQGMTIDSGDLSLALAIEAEPDGSRVHARAIEPLALRNVTLRQGDKKLADRVTLTARPDVDYSPTRVVAALEDLTVSMPSGDALTGKLTADVTDLATKPVVAFTSQLQAKIVTALQPYLPVNTGPLALVSTTQGRLDGDILQLAKATTTINRADGPLLVAIETQQPLRADLKSTTFSASDPQATAARVRLGEIPLAWAQPFVANSKLAGSVAGGVVDISLRSLDDVTLTTAEPVTLRSISVTLDGKPQLNALDVSANLTATKRGDAIAYEVRRIELKQGANQLAGLAVSGEAKLGDKLTLAAKGNLEADVPALTTQPALARFATLARGTVTATFDATVADATQAKAAITAKNLVAMADNRALGDLEINLTASIKPDGSGTINAPITLTNAARKSDLTIAGTFGKASDQKTFLLTGRVTSNNLVVDDFQPLAGLAPQSETAAATPPPARPSSAPRPSPAPAPEAGPFWQGVNGKVEVDLKRVLYGKDYVISPVQGTAVITNSRLSLDGLEGRFKGNPFKVSGGIVYAAQQSKPYALTAAVDIQNLDIGEILRAAAPNEKPVFETKASMVAQLNGSGANLTELFKNAYGKFSLTGTDGLTRLLSRSDTASTITNVASIGLAILGAKNNSQGLTAAAQLTQLLNEVRFDRVQIQVERAADLSFKLTAIEILSPILHTSGTGTVGSTTTGNIANAPMNVVLQLGAKGALAHALNEVGLLSQRTDARGYNLMTKTFTIGGTPAKPDRSALWSLLLQTGLGSFLNR